MALCKAQVAPRLETRSLSPPPQAFTWPVYAAPRVASPPRAVSPVTYVTQRVASPVRGSEARETPRKTPVMAFRALFHSCFWYSKEVSSKG